ncbi:YfjI family protein [Lysobacter niabensis]|uniref:YfjI family protein n=1 Tax=Agrilutibacter niabensis TaxID=380628 RepID=UPI003623D4B9
MNAVLSLEERGAVLATKAAEGFAPEPLRRPLPPAEPYPLEALGEVLGRAARAIHDVVQAPAGLCGQSVLSAASLAAQAHADVLIDGRREPLSLWHVTVGDSGERKSGADKWALQAHREVERAEADAYRQALAKHEVALASHKAAARAAERGKDADTIRASLERLGAPPEPPLAPWLLVPEATLEGLHKLYQGGRGSLGLFNDDAGDFLDGHAMNRDNRTKSAAGFSKLWDSGEFARIRAGDGAAKFYGRRLAMHVMVQPVIAERVLSDDVLTGQGFLPRCLVAWPASAVGSRMYRDGDLGRNPALAHYWSRMRDLLTDPPPLRDGSRNELEPRALTLAPDAKALWVDVHNAIEADMAGDFASVRAWASKAASQVARIAGVLTLVEEPDAGVIRRDTVERAARLAMYHLREAARVVGTASVPQRVRHAEALLGWCRDTDRTLLYSRDAQRNGPNAIRTDEVFTAAMEALEAAGWAEFVDGGAELDGRQRARVWRVRIGEPD